VLTALHHFSWNEMLTLIFFFFPPQFMLPSSVLFFFFSSNLFSFPFPAHRCSWSGNFLSSRSQIRKTAQEAFTFNDARPASALPPLFHPGESPFFFQARQQICWCTIERYSISCPWSGRVFSPLGERNCLLFSSPRRGLLALFSIFRARDPAP